MSVTAGRQVVLGPYLNMALDPPAPYALARLYHYAAGTSTPLDLYTDPNLLIPATQPLQSDARGVFVFYANGSYRLQIRTSVADGDVLLYDWDGVELWHPSATLRSENRGASYPAATDANRGQIFGKIDGSGDLTEVGINKTGTSFAPITFQNDPLVATQQWAKGADLASAATLTLGSDGNYFDVTGTVGITAITAKPAGTLILLQFDGALTLTHNGTSLILANGQNHTTAAGDVFLFVSEGSGNWRESSRLSRSVTGMTQVNGVMTGTITGNYTLAGTYTLGGTPTFPTLPGSVTAGATCTQSPFTANTKTTQAHGLGATPHFIVTYLECLTAELGYSIGDRVFFQNTFAGGNNWIVEYDATNVNIITTATGLVFNKTTPAGGVNITAANWKVVAIPYKVNP